MPSTRSLRTSASFAAITVVMATAAAGAAPAGAAPGDQVREVCAKSVYVKKQPGVLPVGSVTQGQTVTVTRYSPSGRFARIVARTPGYTVRGWVPERYLCG